MFTYCATLDRVCNYARCIYIYIYIQYICVSLRGETWLHHSQLIFLSSHLVTWVTHRCVRESFLEWACGWFRWNERSLHLVVTSLSNLGGLLFKNSSEGKRGKDRKKTCPRRNLIPIDRARFSNFHRSLVTHSWLMRETLCKNMPLSFSLSLSPLKPIDRKCNISRISTRRHMDTRAINRDPSPIVFLGSPWHVSRHASRQRRQTSIRFLRPILERNNRERSTSWNRTSSLHSRLRSFGRHRTSRRVQLARAPA